MTCMVYGSETIRAMNVEHGNEDGTMDSNGIF